jgi:hypothetical protein
VRQALQKEGKDPSIIDMDPEKSYASQVEDGGVEKDVGPPLKDDPEFSKFFKVSGIRLWSMSSLFATHALMKFALHRCSNWASR